MATHSESQRRVVQYLRNWWVLSFPDLLGKVCWARLCSCLVQRALHTNGVRGLAALQGTICCNWCISEFCHRAQWSLRRILVCMVPCIPYSLDSIQSGHEFTAASRFRYIWAVDSGATTHRHSSPHFNYKPHLTGPVDPSNVFTALLPPVHLQYCIYAA